MLILAADTSSQSGGIAALDDKRLLGHVFTENREDYSSRFFLEIQTLLKELSLKMSDFDLFAVAAGPGSFTGLRIGLTAAKGWAEVYGKPIAPISGLRAIAVQTSGPLEFVASVMDARRGQIYGALYREGDGGLHQVGDEVVLRPDEWMWEVSGRISNQTASSTTNGRVSFVSATPELFESALASSDFSGARVEQVSPDLAPWIGRIAFEQAQRGEVVDALDLDANYVRRTDAESYWKDS